MPLCYDSPMKAPLRQLAIIGPTASGKSALALDLAHRYGGRILSIDSLAIYREIDIASAKPSREELSLVPHYGIDLLAPDEPFDVIRFVSLYREAAEAARHDNVPLILVGGSSFYLKTLMDGISPLPPLSEEVCRRVESLILRPEEAYRSLQEYAPLTAQRLAPGDRYRIEKSLLIALQTEMEPVDYFRRHPPVSPITEPLPIFEIDINREALRRRIALRTDAMLRAGLVDEVAALEKRYGRSPQSMKAIGIVEVLEYFDGRLDYRQMREKIVTNTARLAKRQRTFNRSQFQKVTRGGIEELKREIESHL